MSFPEACLIRLSKLLLRGINGRDIKLPSSLAEPSDSLTKISYLPLESSLNAESSDL